MEPVRRPQALHPSGLSRELLDDQHRVSDERRDYLGEGGVAIELENVTSDENGPQGEDLAELLTKGINELGIFRFRQNSEFWDFPRDAPPRYQSIGFFREVSVWEFLTGSQWTPLFKVCDVLTR